MRALVAMSGGVDSSVAAALMKEAGHEVIGVTLKMWAGPNGEAPTAGCCTVSDAEDARRRGRPARHPLLRPRLHRGVPGRRGAALRPRLRIGTDPATLASSATAPSSSTGSSQRLDDFESEVLVTGHHARTRLDGETWSLLRGRDSAKDQSYVLSMLTQRQLSRARFPVGEMTKADVRAVASSLGLRTAAKPESMDICFVGQRDYRAFVADVAPRAFRPGPVVDESGEELGRHDGVAGFTVGQRRGLGVAVGEPRYVLRIEPSTATVVVGSRDRLGVSTLVIDKMTWVDGGPWAGRMLVQYRAHGLAVPAFVDGNRVMFDEPQGAVAPGQTVAFYDAYGDSDLVLGGALIERILD